MFLRGLLGHPGSPRSCRDSLQGPSSPLPLLFGTSISLSGKWGCGQNSACPMGCQDNLPGHAHTERKQVMVLHLQTESPGEVRGLRTMALGSQITMWSRHGQASAGCDPGQGSCGPSGRSPGKPQFLPPGASGPARASPCPQ